MADDKTPPSEMIRVPTALIPAVKELSRLHRQGHTIALLQGLEELISKFDSNIDIDVTPSSKSVLQLEEKLETKLEMITKKLELIERAISSNRYNSQPKQRRQAHPYQQPQVEPAILILKRNQRKFCYLNREIVSKHHFLTDNYHPTLKIDRF
jgi:hypothetical protein